jgi:alkanesulfonate monooxygenase SsuD/methylene tetrahydromethanopterin reductase-like flavin-dependent oxidoreductase (luciferase family)
MALEPRFGLFLSQANKPWSRILEDVVAAEDLGFDHAWLVDHLLDTDGPPELPCLEAWTLLAAIAARTSRIRLGVLVTSNTFRHPSILLKEAVTVDHISGGRVILGLGTGWHADEHRRYGLTLPDPRERVDRLEEAVEIASRLMTEDRVTYRGRYYQLDDAVFEPRPVQQPRIPILIAAHRPRMLRIAARYADQWDTFPELAGAATEGVTTPIVEQMRAFDAAALEAGRDPATIRRSTWGGAETMASDDAYAAFVRRHLDLGFTDVSVTAGSVPRDRWSSIAREVLPDLRAGRPS